MALTLTCISCYLPHGTNNIGKGELKPRVPLARANVNFALSSRNSSSSGLQRSRAMIGVDVLSKKNRETTVQAVKAQGNTDDKVEEIAFVAGAAGRTGCRVVRELAARGFRVRD